MRWTTREIGYLESHAHEGAKAIAAALGRTVPSVQWQASQRGLSLRMRWCCPKCGAWSFKPLNGKTGWCVACTKRGRREQMEREVEDMRREAMTELEEDRLRQAVYSRKNRRKKSETNHK